MLKVRYNWAELYTFQVGSIITMEKTSQEKYSPLNRKANYLPSDSLFYFLLLFLLWLRKWEWQITKSVFSKEVLTNILKHSHFYMNQAFLVKKRENLSPNKLTNIGQVLAHWVGTEAPASTHHESRKGRRKQLWIITWPKLLWRTFLGIVLRNQRLGLFLYTMLFHSKCTVF